MNTPFPNLVRTSTEWGSHIEPPLRSWWPPFKKLQWLAAVTAEDTGLTVCVEKSAYWVSGIKQFGYFNVRCGSSQSGPHDYASAWSTLNGITVGARAVRDTREETT